MNWYEIKNIDSIDSPALVIYKERVKENIFLLKSMVDNDVTHLRPHVKTNKIAEVCAMMMDAGITKFKCATIAEAEMLAMINAPDVLLAYQPVGPKAKRLLQLVQKYTDTNFSCLVDNLKPAEYLSKIFAAENLSLHVFIDVNSGMNRTGTRPENVLQLVKEIQSLQNITVVGIHGYDGHVRDTDLGERKNKSDEAFYKVNALAKDIENITKHPVTIVVGGSPTFPVHAKRMNVECSPGTFVFWDHGYKTNFPDEPFEYAALVVTRVISIIDGTTVCADLGHKSVAAENPLQQRVHFLNAEDIVPVGQSEEHLVLKVPDSAAFQPGHVLYGVPVHICPTVALYERVFAVENNISLEEWKVIARDRRISL